MGQRQTWTKGHIDEDSETPRQRDKGSQGAKAQSETRTGELTQKGQRDKGRNRGRGNLDRGTTAQSEKGQIVERERERDAAHEARKGQVVKGMNCVTL